LLRAAVRRDLAAVRSALLIGERHGLLDAPAPRQAAELLRHSTTFAALKAGAAKDEVSQAAAAGQEARGRGRTGMNFRLWRSMLA
jgi:hypothetical protein